MRNLVVAVLFVGSIAGFGAAHAADGCGPGCHNTSSGACVVDGWASGVRVFNECPAGSRPRRPCPFGSVWKYRTCFPN